MNKFMREKVLVIAAHPDDEVLGCGGTIAKHADMGDDVDILLLADGVSSRVQKKYTIDARNEMANDAAKILGAHPPICKKLPDNMMDSLPLLKIVQLIESVILSHRPTIIYTHHSGDLNIDHQITHRAVVTAARPIPDSTLKAIYTFEVPSSTEWGVGGGVNVFNPVHFVNISSTIDRKMDALKCYDEEMCSTPHARSYDGIRSLCRLRGCQNGFSAAEAFAIVRQHWN